MCGERFILLLGNRLSCPYWKTNGKAPSTLKVQNGRSKSWSRITNQSCSRKRLFDCEKKNSEKSRNYWRVYGSSIPIFYPELEFEQLNAVCHADSTLMFWTNFKNASLCFTIRSNVINFNVLFNDLKFSANTKNFHSPGNSMIRTVLETKRRRSH